MKYKDVLIEVIGKGNITLHNQLPMLIYDMVSNVANYGDYRYIDKLAVPTLVEQAHNYSYGDLGQSLTWLRESKCSLFSVAGKSSPDGIGLITAILETPNMCDLPFGCSIKETWREEKAFKMPTNNSLSGVIISLAARRNNDAWGVQRNLGNWVID